MPEEKQRKSIRVGEIDKMIETLESLERVDKTADYHKRMAIAYLKNFADCLDDKGVKYRKVGGESQVNDEAIHIPARRKQQTGAQMVIKVTPEAYNTLVEIYNESTLSLKQIASLLIVKAAERVVYDKE